MTADPTTDPTADIDFYFDPVCPYCWMTSKWVRQVRTLRDYSVSWRFISLRQLNAHVDYAAQFPPDYEAGHLAGLKLLRVAAAARDEHGPEAVDALYAAMGEHIFERRLEPSASTEEDRRGTPEFVAPILETAGLPVDLAAALDETAYDPGIQTETDHALSLTGKDVGTPIIHFEPPDGVAFFGPVISRMPSDEQAAELWDHVIGLTRFPGFAELKRSLRERPQLASFGVRAGEVGQVEDWHGGSRRQHRG